MQKTPWFCERQADIMLNYLPLKCTNLGYKSFGKNKSLPDSARLCTPRLVSHSFSLSLPLRHGPIKAGLTCLLSLSPMPFILKVPPGSCRGWTPAKRGLSISQRGDNWEALNWNSNKGRRLPWTRRGCPLLRPTEWIKGRVQQQLNFSKIRRDSQQSWFYQSLLFY